MKGEYRGTTERDNGLEGGYEICRVKSKAEIKNKLETYRCSLQRELMCV